MKVPAGISTISNGLAPAGRLGRLIVISLGKVLTCVGVGVFVGVGVAVGVGQGVGLDETPSVRETTSRRPTA